MRAVATARCRWRLLSRVDGDRERPVGQHHADGHLVQPDLALDVGTDAHVTTEEHQRPRRQCMARARCDDRDRRAVQGAYERATVGDERRHRREVTARHHRQIEPGAELPGPAVEHDGGHRCIVLGLGHDGGDRGDDVRRQCVGLAVVDVADQDAVALFGGDCCGGHPPEAIRRPAARPRPTRPSGLSPRRSCAPGSGRSRLRARRRLHRARSRRRGDRACRRRRWRSPAR